MTSQPKFEIPDRNNPCVSLTFTKYQQFADLNCWDLHCSDPVRWNMVISGWVWYLYFQPVAKTINPRNREKSRGTKVISVLVFVGICAYPFLPYGYSHLGLV
eukprot:sb/3478354/